MKALAARTCPLALGVLLAGALGSCTGSQGSPPPSKLWTVEDLRSAAQAGKSLAGIPASNFITLRTQALPYLSPPYSDASLAERADRDGLTVFPAFSEGHTAAYSTTEVWENFAAVWVQPLYVAINGFSNGTPQFAAGTAAIFSVGTRTRFYSPYWQINYFVLPADVDASTFKSAKQVLDSGYPIIQGRGTLCVLAPPDVHLAEGSGSDATVRPLFGDPLPINYAQGYVDGEVVSYIDFGKNRFTWNPQNNVIDEAALFELGLRADDGSLVRLGLPNVGGTGPLFSNTPARVTGNLPQFGSFWHLYTAFIPSGSGIFVPSSRPALKAQLLSAAAGAGSTVTPPLVPPIAAQIEARADAAQYLLRVAVNPGCFQDPAGFPQSCRWLDSQAAVEREIPGTLINDAALYLTCSLLAYNDKAVGP